VKLTLKFFASVREQLGTGHETIDLPSDIETVGQLREFLARRGGAWTETLGQPALRTAFNHTMCGADARLTDEGEVAFFPPVTGG